MSPVNWRLRLPPSHFGLLMLLSQQIKKRLSVLAGKIDPGYQRQIRLLLPNVGKDEYISNIENPLGLFLVLPCLKIKVNRKLKAPNSGRDTNGLTLQE